MKLIEAEGKTFEFPDEATDDQISDSLKSQRAASWWDTIKAVPDTAAGGLRRGVGGVVQMVGETPPYLMVQEEAFKRNVPVSVVEEEYKARGPTGIAEAGKTIAEQGGALAEEASPGQLSYWKKATLSGLSSVSQQAPGLAASVMTKSLGPALGTAAAVAGGTTYADADEAGLPVEKKRNAAAIDATAEALLEMIPLKFFMHNVGGPIGKLIIGTLGREIGTETMTTAINDANAKLNHRPDMTWEDFYQDILDTVGSTAIATPVTAGLGAAVHRAGQRPKAGGPQEPAPGTPPPESPGTPPAPTEMGTLIPDKPPQIPFEHPTTPLDSKTVQDVDTLIASIDADLITPEQLAEAEEVMRKHKEAKDSPVLPEAAKAAEAFSIIPYSPVDDIAELGASPASAANARNYVNPNTGDRSTRVISYSSDDTATGKTLQQVNLKPGTYTLGVPTEDRPADFLEASNQSIEQWRQEFMPDATIVLSNEGLFSGSALGWHYHVGPGQHFIVPAVLRRPSRGLGSFNRNAQATAFYNLTHEFGHALILERFFEGVTDPSAVPGVREESKLGLVSDESIAAMPAPQQAILHEFNAIKQKIMDNSMTAQEFVDVWYGPAKLGRKTLLSKLGVAPTDNAQAVGKAIVRQAVRNSGVQNAQSQAAMSKQLLDNFFSVEEYLAEQTARHAYTRNWDKSSALGQFLSEALQSLRNFFNRLKKDGQIKPGTAFGEWMDGLSKTTRPVTEKEQIVAAADKAAPPAKVVKPKKPKLEKPKPIVERTQHNTETDTSVDKAKQARKIVTNLVKSGAIEANSREMHEMLQLIKQEDWDEFTDLFQRYAVKNVKFELDDDFTPQEREILVDQSVMRAGIPEDIALKSHIMAEAIDMWQKQQFKSPYFKAWFGDWENDAANSSKIRQGAVVTRVVSETWVLTETTFNPNDPDLGPPLVVYHGTQVHKQISSPHRVYKNYPGFERFDRGDIGFHFGTVRAAHERIGMNPPDPNDPNTASGYVNEGKYIMPVVLNIRNPLYIDADYGTWSDQNAVAAYLRQLGATMEEKLRIQRDIDLIANTEARGLPSYSQQDYANLAPVREFFLSKGYDGIAYRNGGEDAGSISYIAFHPNQVKSLLGSRTFSRSDNMHMELDHDGSEKEGVAIPQMQKALSNFLGNLAPWRRAMRRVARLQYHVLELQQLTHLNQHISGLVYMNEKNTAYNTYKSKLQAPADAVLQSWGDQSERNRQRIGNFLRAEADGKELWFDLVKGPEGYTYQPNAKTAEMMIKHGIDEKTPVGAEIAQTILDAKNALLFQLNETEKAFQSVFAKRYAGASFAVLKAAMLPVIRRIQEIRKTPFFPQGRFGNLMLIVEEKSDTGPGWEIVHKEAFESRDEWTKTWEKWNARAEEGVRRVRKYELTDQQYVLMALPLDFLDTAASELDLTPDQVEQLTNILQPVKQEKVLSPYEAKNLGITGYSEDAERSFANFTWHNANLIAKLVYRSEFNNGIRSVATELRVAEYSNDPASVQLAEHLKRVVRFMERTRDYVMSPPNEAQAVRAFVSVTYLALNVKTAVLNLFGLVTTWSDITSRFGQTEGAALLAQATKWSWQSIELQDLNARKKGDYLPASVREALDRALKEGVLSQSYAYHLAGMANSANLFRLPGGKTFKKVSKKGIDLAMWPFRLTELMTRRITFLAQFEGLRREGKLSHEEMYLEAVRRTNLLQNDYSQGNRPPFMRGIKTQSGNRVIEAAVPMATIFMTFMQGMAFHAYGGYEIGAKRASQLPDNPQKKLAGYTAKMWIALLLLAGYEGLPGMENILDFLEIAWRTLGGKKPMRQELRELVQAIDVDPHLAARGLGHNVAGYDVSRSLGLGRLVPGSDTLGHPRDTVAETIGTLALDMAGPAGGFIKFGLEAAFGKKPPAESFTKLPGGIGNIYTSYYWSQHGVTGPSGGQVTHDLTTGKLRDLTAAEIYGKALGFNPAVVSENREVMWGQFEQKIYWQARRDKLLDDVWRATNQKDPEALSDSKKAVTEFNMGVPAEYKDLRVTGADIARSRMKHIADKRAEEAQVSAQRRYKGVYKDVKKSFD